MRTFLPLLLLAATPLAAQPFAPSNTEGLFLQIALDAQSVEYGVGGSSSGTGETGGSTTESAWRSEGGGLALRAGYGVSSLVTLYGGVSGARLEHERGGSEHDFGAGEVGARFGFNRGRALRPYLDVALRAVVARSDAPDVESRGGALALGAGVAYFLSPTVALDAALHVGRGRFDEFDLGPISVDIRDEDGDFREARLSVGLTAYPFR